MMMVLTLRQKQLLGEFLSNFALVWISFGIVSPLFSGVDDAASYLIGFLLASFTGAGSLFISLSLVK